MMNATYLLKLLDFVEVPHPECLIGDLCWDQLGVQCSHMGAAHQNRGDVRLTGLDVKLGLPLRKNLICSIRQNNTHTVNENTISKYFAKRSTCTQ